MEKPKSPQIEPNRNPAEKEPPTRKIPEKDPNPAGPSQRAPTDPDTEKKKDIKFEINETNIV